MSNNITNLRKLFLENSINGYIISTKDEYLSEYPPASARRLEYLTGFTGSNGLAIVLEHTVLFFTDGRYLTQVQGQLDPNIFQVFDQKLLGNFPWNEYIATEGIIGYDPHIFTNYTLLTFKSIQLKAIDNNLVDIIWEKRPPAPNSEIYEYDIAYSGKSSQEKIVKCREFLNKHKADLLIITNPESVCWLFNIRASDIEFSPILLANAYITKSDAAIAKSHETIAQIVSNTPGKILFDDNSCSKYLADLIKQKSHQSIPNPCILWKACKNEVEITRMIEGHIQDGIAVCEFLAFLANNDLDNYSEYDLGLKLTEYRSQRKNYVSDSFPAIIGFGSNGAIIHYQAIKDTAKKIQGNGLLLIDSGGQYLGATTDITRVVAIGDVKPEYEQYYTKILKGHLALAMIKFPADSVTGANLDVLARQFLWEQGDDYPHGTGHGVGSFLSVHEGPQNISLTSYSTKLAEGMVLSNEPGYYCQGKFGIRIENLMWIGKMPIIDCLNHFLQFNMLTLVPYEKNLIDFSLLSRKEILYLEEYYQEIERKILPHLSLTAGKWLNEQLIII